MVYVDNVHVGRHGLFNIIVEAIYMTLVYVESNVFINLIGVSKKTMIVFFFFFPKKNILH